MSYTVTIREIETRSPEFVEARRLRYAVLYQPIGVAEAEVRWDDDVPGSSHCVAFAGAEMVGYGRLVCRDGNAQIRHLAVAPGHRGKGIGGRLLDELVAQARGRGVAAVFLNARFTALGMYRSRGFESVGPIIHTESTHLPHQRMELALG